MSDPQNPLVDAMETYGEEERLLATGTCSANLIIVLYEAQQEQECFQEMPLFLGESHRGPHDRCECSL